MNPLIRSILLASLVIGLSLGAFSIDQALAAAAPASSGPPERGGGAILFPILLLLIIATCAGFLYPEGLWSNAVRLVNVVTAALLATNFWEPTAKFLDDSVSSSFTFFWDFVALWGLFGVLMVLFRQITNKLSQVKVRFLKIADQIGSGVLSVLIGWVMVCFTVMSLHTAPLSRYFMFGAFVPEESKLLGMNPDMQWLGFVQQASTGAFSRSEPQAFDPGGRFIANYALRRDSVEKYRTDKCAFRIGDGEYGSSIPSR